MTTILDYVRQAHSPLRADLSPADALALSCLVYVDFHALSGPRSPRGCLLREVAQASSIPSLYRSSSPTHADRGLLEAAGSSARFGGLRVCDAVTRLGTHPLAQFGAVTFIDEAGATYVVFRGTDASAVGWAEDARFGLDYPTDSQRWAARYLAYAVSRAQGPVTVIGHSKGRQPCALRGGRRHCPITGAGLRLRSGGFSQLRHRRRVLRGYSRSDRHLCDGRFVGESSLASAGLPHCCHVDVAGAFESQSLCVAD